MFYITVFFVCLFVFVLDRSNPASFMATPFLFYYEEKWMQKTKQKYLVQAWTISKNLPEVNDVSEFEKLYHEIYPPELELNYENSSNNEESFLDLEKNIVNKKFF